MAVSPAIMLNLLYAIFISESCRSEKLQALGDQNQMSCLAQIDINVKQNTPMQGRFNFGPQHPLIPVVRPKDDTFPVLQFHLALARYITYINTVYSLPCPYMGPLYAWIPGDCLITLLIRRCTHTHTHKYIHIIYTSTKCIYIVIIFLSSAINKFYAHVFSSNNNAHWEHRSKWWNEMKFARTIYRCILTQIMNSHICHSWITRFEIVQAKWLWNLIICPCV